MFIRAMSLGKLKGVDTLEKELKLLAGKYPNSDITPLANDVLMAIKKQKNPELFQTAIPGTSKDTFVVNLETEHFIALVGPDDPKMQETLRNNIKSLNQNYYADKQYKSSYNLFGNGKQIYILKSFPSGKEAVNYYQNLLKEPQVFSGSIKKELFDIFPITADNLALMYKKKNSAGYLIFYKDNYKSLESSPQLSK